MGMLIGMLLFAVMELTIGISCIALVCGLFKHWRRPWRYQRALFTASCVVFASPVLAPAGFIAVVPVPQLFLLLCLRSLDDAQWLWETAWFGAPSMLVSGFVAWYLAGKLLQAGASPTDDDSALQ